MFKCSDRGQASGSGPGSPPIHQGGNRQPGDVIHLMAAIGCLAGPHCMSYPPYEGTSRLKNSTPAANSAVDWRATRK